VYEVALTTTVDAAKSVFVPTGHAGGGILQANGASAGISNHGIAVKSDGSALQVYTRDVFAGTYRITGVVIEYY
jgi:hypothetical protein